jgi:hypothetical protein
MQTILSTTFPTKAKENISKIEHTTQIQEVQLWIQISCVLPTSIVNSTVVKIIRKCTIHMDEVQL